MRKRLVLFLVCLASVLLAGYVTLWLTSSMKLPHLLENSRRIKVGMNEAEVKAILGSEAGSIPEGTLYAPGSLQVDSINTRSSKDWVGEDIDVSIGFDADGRVTSIDQRFVMERPETFLDKLRRWLGIQ